MKERILSPLSKAFKDVRASVSKKGKKTYSTIKDVSTRAGKKMKVLQARRGRSRGKFGRFNNEIAQEMNRERNAAVRLNKDGFELRGKKYKRSGKYIGNRPLFSRVRSRRD